MVALYDQNKSMMTVMIDEAHFHFNRTLTNKTVDIELMKIRVNLLKSHWIDSLATRKPMAATSSPQFLDYFIYLISRSVLMHARPPPTPTLDD